MRLRHVLFDLDGTLIDSLPGIEASARAAVEAVLPARQLPPLKPYVGPPLPIMLRRALGEMGEDVLARLAAAFRNHYDAIGWRASVLFDGAATLLARLSTSGMACYVVTNKRRVPALQILEHLGLLRYFQEVVAPEGQGPAFVDKPAATLALVKRRGIDPAAALFVGDSEDDARAARECGMRFAAALYGYGNPAADEQCEPLLRLGALSDY